MATLAAMGDRRGAFDEFGGLLPWVGAENGPLPAEVLALLADRDDQCINQIVAAYP